MSVPILFNAATGKGPWMLVTNQAKWWPVVFVLALIFSLFYIYVRYHAYPLYADSQLELPVVVVGTTLLLICYLRCIFTHPGTVPEDSRWTVEVATNREISEILAAGSGYNPQEFKRSGDRRHCKWCVKYKPDRCHHCRVCRTCILKMDHHCPWIYNCVGFRNHKYFFLLLCYSCFDCHWIFWTMWRTVALSLNPSTPVMDMLLPLFCETLAGFLGFVVTGFLGLHIYLMLKAMTTIEFCEKSMKRIGYDSSIYDRGAIGNIKAVLGDEILLWPLPLAPPAGEGLVFVTEDTPLLADVEGGRGETRHSAPKAEPQPEPRRRSSRPQTSGGTGSAPATAEHSEDDFSSSEERSGSNTESPTDGEKGPSPRFPAPPVFSGPEADAGAGPAASPSVDAAAGTAPPAGDAALPPAAPAAASPVRPSSPPPASPASLPSPASPASLPPAPPPS